MRRLTGTDALFLSMETPTWHQHVGGLTILDPGDREISFDELLAALEARVPYAPKLRWKLKSMPLGLARPSWIDDEDFDIRNHVRRIGVPRPGGFRETAEVAGMLASTQLDRNRPLWELWFLEGLAGGRLAFVMKYHHCLLDGVAGASLATVLLDLDPDATEPLNELPSPAERSAGSEPDHLEVLGQVAGSLARRPLHLARYLVDGAAKLSVGANAMARDDDARTVFRAPATPFNKPIGPRRGLAFSSVALDDLRELKDRHGVKINDLVIALVAASFREVLLDRSALPDAPLVTGVPVSTRAAGDETHDNQVSNMFVSMATDIADPVERLQAIYASSQKAKALQRALSARQIQSLGEVASPLVLSTAIRALYESRIFGRGFTPVNTVVSNVPGPPVPVYMCGARVTGMFPCSVIVDGMGVNATVISIMERVDFGFHVDPDIVSDPWALADAVPRALAELKAASGLAAPIPVQDAFGETSGRPRLRPEPLVDKCKDFREGQRA